MFIIKYDRKMKKITGLFITIFILNSVLSAQCTVNYKEILEKYCDGVYLEHFELENTAENSVDMVLKANNKYTVYLLNSTHPITNFKLSCKSKIPVRNIETKYNREENYMSCFINITETQIYSFNIDFGTKKDGCVLFAIFYRNKESLKPGIYKNFDEFKYNSPSLDFDYNISSKKRKYGVLNLKGEVNYYRINIDKKEGKEIGKVFGFSDGKHAYINVKNPYLKKYTEFLRVKKYDNYSYFEEVKSTTIYTGHAVISTNDFYPKIIDMNSGEVTDLTKKRLRKIIEDDNNLLTDFNNGKHNKQKMKEYLLKYLEKYKKY